jgi:hypothetical protein
MASAYLLLIKQLWVTRLSAAAGLVPQRALSQGLSAAIECGCDDTQAFGTQAFGNETLEWCQIELKSR